MYRSYSSKQRKKRRVKQAQRLQEYTAYLQETITRYKPEDDYILMQKKYSQAMPATPPIPTDPLWIPAAQSGFKKSFSDVQKRITGSAKQEEHRHRAETKSTPSRPYGLRIFY